MTDPTPAAGAPETRGLREALEQIAALRPRGPFAYPSDELAEAQAIARAALATAPEPSLLAAARTLLEYWNADGGADLDDAMDALEIAVSHSTSREADPPKSYWMEFLAYESEAAKQGSGMTEDQMTGAAMFRSWLVNHAPDDGRPEATSREAGLDADAMRATMPDWFGQVPDWALYEWAEALRASLAASPVTEG